MAKVSFNKLGLKVNDSIRELNFHDQVIEVKQYVPVNEMLDLIGWTINQSADDMKFYNVGKINIFKDIAIVQHFTNINITDKQLEDPAHLWDLLSSTGLMDMIYHLIPEDVLDWFTHTLWDTVNAIYKYQNSVMGILDIVSADYQNLDFDITKLQQNMADPNNLALLKDVVTKLG